jgi:hypothetical protein
MPDAMRARVKEVVEKALKLDKHGRVEVVEVFSRASKSRTSRRRPTSLQSSIAARLKWKLAR